MARYRREKKSKKKYFLISISYIDADSVVLGSNWCSFECWRILFLRSSIFVAHFSSKCQEVSNDSLWWHIDTFIGCALTQNCGNDRRERKAYNIFQIQIDPLLSFTRYVVHPSGSYSKESMFLCEPRGGKNLTNHLPLSTASTCEMWLLFFTHCWEREKKNEPHSSRQTNESTIYFGCNTMCSPFSHSIIVFNEFDKFFGTNSLRRSTRELNRVKPTGVCYSVWGLFFFALN